MTEVVNQTLHIVARELHNELNEARVALENFGDQQDDIRLLETCRERLHNVYGALRVAEVNGAALLAEEMEHVVRHLIANAADKSHLAEGLDALLRAVVQLPAYLDRVLAGGRDMALILLPLLNDLRAVRGHALLSEATLLLLNLTSDKKANPQAAAPGQPAVSAIVWARKLRPQFQLSMLGLIREERIEQNLKTMADAVEKIEQTATEQSVFQLWWVVGAMLEALREQGLENSASIKRLLGQADREMRRLYEIGEQQYAQHPPVSLLNNLLYYISRVSTSGPRVTAVRASFKLAELLPVDPQVEAARASLSAPSVKLMKTVASAIKEDLARVKDAFDIFVRQSAAVDGAKPSAAQLTPQLDMLRKIADTLGVLGLSALREKVQAELAELKIAIDAATQSHPGQSASQLGEANLMRIAGTLISIEDNLDQQLVGLISPTSEEGPVAQAPPQDMEFRQVSEAVLRECMVNMARIKEAITLAVEKPREPQVLEQVPELIRGITAGLLMLGKARAVQIAENIGRTLANLVGGDGAPASREAMERLADAIVAMEYYIETVHAGRADPLYMLDNAETCLRALSNLADNAAHTHGLPSFADQAATLALDPSGATAQVSHVERTEVIGGDAQSTQVFGSGAQSTQVIGGGAQSTQVIPQQHAQQQAAAQARSGATVLPGTVRTLALPALSPTNKVDPELVELFIEEAREEISRLEQLFPRWADNPEDQESLTQVRRSFHTLKGSGRMVGALAIGELAWVIESALNRIINRTLERTPELVDIVREAIASMPMLVEQLESGRDTGVDVGAMIASVHDIASLNEGHTPQRATRSAPPAAKKAPPAQEPVRELEESPPMDPVLVEVFSKEAAGHLTAIRDFIASCALLSPPYPVTEELHRACHTLRGAANTAGARHSVRVMEPLNHYIRKLFDNGVGLPPAGLQVLKDAVRAMDVVVAHANEGTGYFATHQGLVERIERLDKQADVGLTQLNRVLDVANAPKLDFEAPSADLELPSMLPGEGEDDDMVEMTFETKDSEPTIQVKSPTRMMKALDLPPELRQPPEPAAVDFPLDQMEDFNIVLEDDAVTEEEPTAAIAPDDAPEKAEVAITLTAADAPPASATDDGELELDADFDADVAAIFTEEASELLELADAALSSWSRDRANQAALFELKRVVHTLKGGARMAGIRAMGNLSHELETFVERVESGGISSERNVIEVLQQCLDELHRMRDAIAAGRGIAAPRVLIARLHALAGIATPDEAPRAAQSKPVEPPTPPKRAVSPPVREATPQPMLDIPVEVKRQKPVEPLRFVKAEESVEPEVAAPVALPGREQVREERQQEVARVDAELLDMLLNNAGEVSILRSRVEQQVNSIEFNLQELDRTVSRLKEQLRNMELETEAQILHRHQEDKAGREDFDPLELDRYSQIQQLSRALAESVSDVASIEGLLENLTRDTQNLLSQQSRVVNEVQNGLMRTRMVPFQRHVQRLSRLVRQTAAETDKQAELLVAGASGELDRQVLERMLPPFEHMLRNSVVHGIEAPQARRAAGKPEAGTIKISLHREGAEMVIVVEDDGRGIDVKAVRARAIERGLLSPGRTLTDEEALQLVLEPGFSTASSVTQHAGRGVGMDVVVAEIKKLGGVLFTQSTPGHGVKFTIRLPFTLAIVQSLLARLGDEQYAIPLPTVESVVRVPREEVLNHLRQEQASFGYGGQKYRVQHLGGFVGAPTNLPETDAPVPLILIRAGEHSTALVAEELLGNREIVVKPVGQQIAGIRGVAGATIMGDGRIVIILDMGALVRSEWRARRDATVSTEDRRNFALVVDDSITVRRVTQRLLERNGMRVMTAKDGMDALEVMQEHVPDIILLDVEMPRMDGYELATRVRGDKRLRDIPIVMITSRVGEKHRARAIEIGVNDYLGKPYQENQLLDAIEPLIEAHRRRMATKGRVN